MARTRAVPRRRPNINFDLRKVAAAKEVSNRRQARGNLIVGKHFYHRVKTLMLKNEVLLSDKCVYVGDLFIQVVLEITDMVRN